MILSKRNAILLAGVAVSVSCAPLIQPQTNPQPQAKIVATSDATYMQPVGASNEHMVPEPPPKTPFDDFAPHAGGAAPASSAAAPGIAADGDRLAALETRVTRLERKLDAMGEAHPMHADTQARDMQAKDIPPSGEAAPPPASVQPAPLGAAADAAPVSLAASVAASVPVKSAVPAKRAIAPGKITALRIGEHPGLTRIVLDCGERHAFHADLDNDEHILTVQIADAAWSGGAGEHATPHSPLVSSWQAAPDGKGGTRLVVQLRSAAKLSADHFLPGSGVVGARLVVDLAKV